MAKKYDVDSIKAAASGRWPEILTSLGGIPTDILDGNHHPCPRCGGEDRFRMFDDGSGGVICNQCHAKENHDGFATIMWMLGCTFPESLGKVADYLGVKSTRKKSTKSGEPPTDPTKDLEFMPWSSPMARYFMAAKPGITEESLLAQGCLMARYKKSHTVIVWPIIGNTLDVEKPVGYVVMDYKARPLPKYDRNGNVVGQTGKKITYGSKPGLVGVHGIERLKTDGLVDVVWKAEGITDAAALWSAIPENLRDRHIVITNANGASETPKWPADILSNFNTNLLHDCDTPGQAGAKEWGKFIASKITEGKTVRNVVLPYDIEDKKGKDIRDWLTEGNSYGDLLNLADKAEPIVVARTEGGEIDLTKVQYPIQEKILKLLKIDVIREDETGAIHIFSMFLRKTSRIPNIERYKYEKLIADCGAPAMEHVVAAEADLDTTFSMLDVRKSIALASSTRRRDNEDLRGIGVWQGIDDYGNETDTVVLVNGAEGARYNGDKVLRKILAPRADGLVLDFGSGGQDWFDFEMLDRNLKNAADTEWCQKVIEQAFELFARWKWKNDDLDPTLITGLILATWVQSVWAWRPLVSVVGESNAGKSFLFEALGGSGHQQGIFGRLAFKQSKSSEPGIRQGIGNTSRVIICDEFEKSHDRERVLEMFRASTRGDIVAKGTTGSQKGKQFKLQNIAWTAAIEAGLQRQPDMNRFVQFELLRPDRKDHGKLVLPGGRELHELGQKLLAIAVAHVARAKKLAIALKDTKVDADARMVESYAVPAVMLGSALGFDENQCRNLLTELVEGTIEKHGQGGSDSEELLDSILAATINCGSRDGQLSVGQIVEDSRGSRFVDHNGKLEAAGIRLNDTDDLFLLHKQVARGLLRGSHWEGQRIDQILLRIPGTQKVKLRVAGRPMWGILVPAALIRQPQSSDELWGETEALASASEI